MFHELQALNELLPVNLFLSFVRKDWMMQSVSKKLRVTCSKWKRYFNFYFTGLSASVVVTQQYLICYTLSNLLASELRPVSV